MPDGSEPHSDSGIPSGVIAPIDVGHLRKSLSDAGFTVGGFYLGETFANTGGIHQGATYDGVLWTYLLADLHKAGLWKGLCFIPMLIKFVVGVSLRMISAAS